MKKNLTVVQRNSFIRGDFGFLEAKDIKILKLLVSKVNSKDKEFNDYYYITKDEVRSFNFNKRNIHKDIKTSLRKLSSVFVLVKDNDDVEIEVSLVGKIIYDKKRGVYKVPLSDDLKMYLLDIKKEFTSYKLENLIFLSRKEEIKLYEYLKSVNFEVFVISIENLKVIMELNQKSYQTFFNFHKKLKEAVLSINAHTDITISFIVLKQSRLSKNIQFTIYRFNTTDNSVITIDTLKHRYINKQIHLNGDCYNVKEIVQEVDFLIVYILSENATITGRLKFRYLEDIDNYLKNNH